MKKIILFLAFLLILTTTACEGKDVPEEETYVTNDKEFIYLEELDTLDSILEYSTDVVRATLVSTDDFDGSVNVYLFDVKENYFGHAQGEIHMYDAYDPQYVVGHTYYLFLCGSDSALYPHTIYTTVVKDMILDEAALKTAAHGNGSAAEGDAAQIEARVAAAAASGTAGKKAGGMFHLSEASEIGAVSEQADVVAEIRLISETAANRYVSIYAVELLDTLKGPEGAVGSYMNLPPDLDKDTTYYVFLKENPECPGDYLLCSRAYPVADMAVFSAEELSLDG